MARDLRQISAALKMITDMERIGDQAEDIAEIIPYLGGRIVTECEQIRDMAKATIQMVTESVDAYVKQDVKLAQTVIGHDDIVDDYFQVVKRSLIDWIAKKPGKRGVCAGSADGQQVLRAYRGSRHQHRRVGDLLRHRDSRGGVRHDLVRGGRRQHPGYRAVRPEVHGL